MGTLVFTPPRQRPIAGTLDKPRKFARKTLTIHLTLTERMFLLHRLADITSTVEAITHHPDPALHRSPWERSTARAAVLRMVAALRDRDYLLIIGELDRRVLREGIEGNRYFLMPGRAVTEHIRIAERLRQKIVEQLRRQIRRFPLPDQDGSEAVAA